jgi:Mn2+/Fe2+ NRAMP family transporter
VPMLTPMAAAGLIMIMMATHVRRKESPTPPLVLGILAAIVAVGGFVTPPWREMWANDRHTGRPARV